jgi:hypothetical protein
MRIRITANNYTATLAHHSNSRGYCTYWQERGMNFVRSLCVLYEVAVGNRKLN